MAYHFEYHFGTFAVWGDRPGRRIRPISGPVIDQFHRPDGNRTG
ncbi:MAG: hypothetical protein QOF81_1506 [Acidimicrobiaceae bacterium]|jgi:hypothetical protein|nr:hypothetical protein [Acidimicrobiaceae bacterium]MDQ1415893.1 hypothetical protein [Acidimicrobiaceae bacterium]MDQ1442660.1 hypothetical protein [Acidimicrobiaceae bacterium]